MISNGIDLVEINRFEKLINNNTFLNNNFNDSEIKYINEHNSLSTIAGIYASKEAMLKALKKGINNYSLKDIEISHDITGYPFIILHNNIKNDFNLKDISLSISHDGAYAIAIVSIIIS
jgi:holo-[acyl-carrier protein] synthase